MIVARASAKSTKELVAAIDVAAGILGKSPPLADELVHDARKAIKKGRAVLRLLREGIGESVYKTENAALRDAGRCLAPIRDAKSLSDALAAFRERRPHEGRDLGALAIRLNAKGIATRQRLFEAPGRLRDCSHVLASSRSRIRAWRTTGLRPSVIALGIRRIHRAGRKTLAGAKREPTPEALHEWRKQVKYLLNALETIEASGDKHLEKAHKRAEELADCLGDDHDLAELARVFNNAGVSRKTIGLIDRQRGKLQKRAYALGAKIYDEKPKRFAESLNDR